MCNRQVKEKNGLILQSTDTSTRFRWLLSEMMTDGQYSTAALEFDCINFWSLPIFLLWILIRLYKIWGIECYQNNLDFYVLFRKL